MCSSSVSKFTYSKKHYSLFRKITCQLQKWYGTLNLKEEDGKQVIGQVHDHRYESCMQAWKILVILRKKHSWRWLAHSAHVEHLWKWSKAVVLLRSYTSLFYRTPSFSDIQDSIAAFPE
jgi:hypothetical protein